jgi:integrase
MAHIRQLPSGKWQAQIRRGGKLISHSARTKAAVLHWAKATEIALDNGTYSDKTEQDRAAHGMTLGEALRRYEEEVLQAKDKGRRRVRCAKGIALFDDGSLAARPLRLLTKRMIVDYVLRRRLEVKSDTVRKDLNLLAKTINRAIHIWHVNLSYSVVTEARSALKATEDLEPGERRERRLLRNHEVDEEKALMAVVSRADARGKDIVQFTLETAMRRGEIASLKHADIESNGRIVNVRHSKTDHQTGLRGRRFPISAKALEIVRRQPRRTLDNGDVDPRVFCVAPDSITNAFKRLCARAGIEGLRFHDLRHEATSRLVERGYSFAEVMLITGHTAADMVARYSHLLPEDVASKFAREISHDRT